MPDALRAAELDIAVIDHDEVFDQDTDGAGRALAIVSGFSALWTFWPRRYSSPST